MPNVDIRENLTKDLYSHYKNSKKKDKDRLTQLRSLMSGTPIRHRTPKIP